MRTCPYCAEEIPAAAVACPVCGMDLRNAPRPMPAAQRPPSSSTKWILIAAVLGGAMVLVVPCLIALLLPAVQSAREAARRTQCKNNLKQIGLALHNYHDVYGAFPPAYVADANGRPMHSWRVLILPYLEQAPLYNKYDFSQPWDSPANQFVAQSMPRVFACPSHAEGLGGTRTHYCGVFGPHSFFRGERPIGIRDIVDGISNTIMVGEVKTSVPWTSPEDVDVTQGGGFNAAGFGSHHVGGAHFLFCDGAVRFIPQTTAPDVMRALFTTDGNEVVNAF